MKQFTKFENIEYPYSVLKTADWEVRVEIDGKVVETEVQSGELFIATLGTFDRNVMVPVNGKLFSPKGVTFSARRVSIKD